MKPGLFLCAFLLVCASVTTAQTDPIVNVTGGEVRGYLTSDGGAAFKGIPFARPPVGDLRWREPQPVDPWEGVRETNRFGAPCTQLSEGWNDAFVETSTEDCLYLNVAPPSWPPKDKYPVMVWIHGGSNTAGDGQDAGFEERTLVRRGIVLVTINYRLGALGFLTHPELDSESPHHTSGNYGLMDQIAALHWVQENIEKFGGDPGRVTVFGESAGAFDIGLLMTSPLAKGLFHGAIAESGAVASFHGPRTKARAEQVSAKLATRLNAPESGAIRTLREVPAVTILKEARLAEEGNRTGLETSVDGWVLPESPAAVFAKGHSAPVPMIVGSNAQEIPGPDEPIAIRAKIRESYRNLADAALELYRLSGKNQGRLDPVYGGSGIQWETDAGFRCPSTAEASGHAGAGHPTYQYEFQHPQPGKQFTSHNSELKFLFGTWGKDVQLSENDRKTSEQMQRYWTNFAQMGNPNGEGLPEWPKFTQGTQSYLAFSSDGAVAQSGLRREYCELWRKAQVTEGSN